MLPTEVTAPSSAMRSVYRMARYWLPAIAVVDEPGEVRCAPAPDRHLEGVEGELGAQGGRHPPADDRAAEGVDDERRLAEARPRGHVADIGNPQPVGLRGREHAVDEVRGALAGTCSAD